LDTQRAKQVDLLGGDGTIVRVDDGTPKANLTLIEGVKQFTMSVKELNIDLIDRINPFDTAYAVLAKAMDEKTSKQVQAVIAARKIKIPIEEAGELAKRAIEFKCDRDRLPDINAADPWEKRTAEGIAVLARFKAAVKREEENGNAQKGPSVQRRIRRRSP
jgi:hypothetical protein